MRKDTPIYAEGYTEGYAEVYGFHSEGYGYSDSSVPAGSRVARFPRIPRVSTSSGSHLSRGFLLNPENMQNQQVAANSVIFRSGEVLRRRVNYLPPGKRIA